MSLVVNRNDVDMIYYVMSLVVNRNDVYMIYYVMSLVVNRNDVDMQEAFTFYINLKLPFSEGHNILQLTGFIS